MKEEVDLNNSDNTENQSLNTEGINLVPNDQVSIRVYKERYNINLVSNDQEVEIGNQAISKVLIYYFYSYDVIMINNESI